MSSVSEQTEGRERRDSPTGGDLEEPLVVVHEAAPEFDEHIHYSHRAPWLRAFVLGANDGLVSVSSIMLGVAGGSSELKIMRLAGVAGWIAGALSMACGEYISVSSQRDTEAADVEKERREQEKGPAARAHELEELTQIYCNRGLSPDLARQVAEELTEKDAVRAHARDELGIDIDELANPWQAAIVSCLAFTLGAIIPILAGGFIADYKTRLYVTSAAATGGLALFGLIGAALGGADVTVGASRVVIGGWLAMAATFGIGNLFGVDPA
ncbi:Ccc1 family [Dunaliella salina]|uniref:Ccc1 family n=1 Tax=Dunaliella salina TaxID=3046 RepID=A0ABQ7H6U2_DUNSA|nr:Ccc1 family [Dunaliella salina]|eukprot:KAF5842572.1 Ccc1 family [Dunaliella salina]